MRTLYFEQIADERFVDVNTIYELEYKILSVLNSMEGVYARSWGVREVIFPHNTQKRCEFTVTKTTRKVTWNDIYKAVNSIRAVPYRFV